MMMNLLLLKVEILFFSGRLLFSRSLFNFKALLNQEHDEIRYQQHIEAAEKQVQAGGDE
jgi:hypothetical protein